MEITGKIIAVLEPRKGKSQRTGNDWMSQEYVLETHEQYPRRCCFRVFGEDKIKNMNIQVGEELTVSFDIDAREWQGRWFNDISAWKVDRVQVGVTPAPAAAAAQTPAPDASAIPSPAAPAANEEDDLPF
ncbi:MAG: DUF3127 domain-containing protein [Bacteroidaceae bacterium]|nr:DUF3127 domain-containing protein [Bacteroidaceae bacterium]